MRSNLTCEGNKHSERVKHRGKMQVTYFIVHPLVEAYLPAVLYISMFIWSIVVPLIAFLKLRAIVFDPSYRFYNEL